MKEQWIVTTDEFTPTTQVFDTEAKARAAIREFKEVRHYDQEGEGKEYNIYLAKVIEVSEPDDYFEESDL